MNTIGIIGGGVVGDAVHQGVKHAFRAKVYDRNKGKANVESLDHLLAEVDSVIFLCLPTPMLSNGSCDVSIIESVLKDLNKKTSGRHLVLKSTVPPGTTEELRREFPANKLCFNPEFLTEANAVDDFATQDRIILGGRTEDIWQVEDVYKRAFPTVDVYKTSNTAAEMVKYLANCYLAVKVAFANEMAQLCRKLGIRYDEVKTLATLDPRLGHSHWDVPGPDGKKGFGGVCLPKDINALIRHAEDYTETNLLVCKAAWLKNIEVRPEKDWEKEKGRAVSA